MGGIRLDLVIDVNINLILDRNIGKGVDVGKRPRTSTTGSGMLDVAV
jgi:hypothetical protein